jgi:hypothetical protein
VGKPPTPNKPIAWTEIPCEGSASSLVLEEDGPLSAKHLYATLQSGREDRWRSLVLAYEENPGDFYGAWQWLNEHPIFYRCHREFHERDLEDDRGILSGSIEVIPVKVNPETGTRSEDDTRNTQLQFWVEVFPRSVKPECSIGLHDYRRDTGGDTYEQAIVEVAKEIYAHYGNDRETLDTEWTQ